MAKVKKPHYVRQWRTSRGKQKKLKTKKPKPWLENKIARIRSFGVRLSPRAFKFAASAGVLIFVAIILISNFLPKDKFQQAKEKILKNPNDLEARSILAEELLKNNNLKQAEKELLTTQQSGKVTTNQSKVLGITTKLEGLWTAWQEKNPEEIRKKIDKWENFLSQNPTYRDGWLTLTLNYYKLKELEKAKFALEKARTLDPNSPLLPEFDKIVPP